MSNDPILPSAEASVQKLIGLVRILIALVVLHLVVSIGLGLAPSLFINKVNNQLTVSSHMGGEAAWEGFSDWPIEKQIDAASVIFRTEYEKSGDRVKPIIKEILKQSPDTKFFYKVGDEYQQFGHIDDKSLAYTDGMVCFCVGSPASMRFATSYSKSREMGSGMNVEDLREKIKSRASKRS